MEQTLVITEFRGKKISCLIEDNELVEVWAESEGTSLLSNIYVGKIKNVVQNINAAFVEIADGIQCHLDIAECKSPIFIRKQSERKISIGDELLVQIQKESIKTKLAGAVSCINLAGRYAVIIHGKEGIAVSNKIIDKNKTAHIKELVQAYASDKYEIIVRTNAQYASDEELLAELGQLAERYKRLISEDIHKKCFSIVETGLPEYLFPIRDVQSDKLGKIVTDIPEVYEAAKQYLESYRSANADKISLYKDENLSLYNLYSLDKKLKNALSSKVWLKSGANIIIEQLETLTVIDVNTGKCIKGKQNSQETFLRINEEAAAEIAKQLRIRCISGVIIVDFIDLTEQSAKKQLIETLKKELSKDSVKVDFIDVTKLNLFELTRKKVRKSLKEALNADMTD